MSADDNVAFFLSKGASPDAVDSIGMTALSHAIGSRCSSTIDLLAAVTNEQKNEGNRLASAIQKLAFEMTEVTPAIEDLLRRISLDQDIVKAGIETSATCGALKILKILTETWDEATLRPSIANRLLEKALKSDCAETVKYVMGFVSEVSSENRILALTRGRSDVVKLFGLGEDKESEEASKRRLKSDIMTKTASVVNRLPKSVEFAYSDEMTKLRPLLSQSMSMVPYDDLLRTLHVHVPPVHAEEECPEECEQKEDCDRLRQVYFLVRLLVLKMGEINPVFKLGLNRHPSIIGSMREQTRIFFNNEVDVHISLNKVLKEKFFFDQESQQLRANEKIVVNDHIRQYVSDDGVFDCKKYAVGFMECIEEAVNSVDLSQGFEVKVKGHTCGMKRKHMFTMEPLSTSYVPCLRCMLTTETGRPQARRCRHRPDCEPHKHGVAECRNSCSGICESFSHERTCDCQEYTSPCLTFTKIGVALHVKFVLKDGFSTFVDCDINIPTIPTCTRYDGSVMDVCKYLVLADYPVGWLEERSKLVDMSKAARSPFLNGSIHAENWQVMMR